MSVVKLTVSAGMLALPNGDVLVCRYSAGDCNTIDAAEPNQEDLHLALYDEREIGGLPADCRSVELPNGDVFYIR